MSDSLPPLREVVARHGLAAKKSLGQNFLFDLNLTGKIARAAGPLDDATVLEIGPGPGGLTRALLVNGAKKVIAVERDERCLAALEEIAQAYPGRLDIVPGDALTLDYPAFLAERGIVGKIRICANLPYNIGTQLLAGWLSAEPWPPFYERMVLMFQREVAERIVATPRERADYGRLGVLAGWRSVARILFDVPPSAFTPPPKIVSSVVELRPREEPFPCDAKALEMVTLAAFGQRRKMLRQSLKGLPGIGDPAPLLEEAGIEPTRRAEEIEVSGFCALARAYAARRG
jgi:16S rRNA (adenine1518-N6/adenine1519-N6)-dimethyltransferase